MAQPASKLDSDATAENWKHSASQLFCSYCAGSSKILAHSSPQSFRRSRPMVASLRYSRFQTPAFASHAQCSLFGQVSPHCQWQLAVGCALAMVIVLSPVLQDLGRSGFVNAHCCNSVHKFACAASPSFAFTIGLTHIAGAISTVFCGQPRKRTTVII